MAQKRSKIPQFWQELKRRRVFHVIMVYASVAWLLIQLVNNLLLPLNLPTIVSTIVIIALAVGFPLAIILAWIYQLTPEGIEETKAEGMNLTKVEMAYRYMMVDKPDKAMEWLEKGFEAHDPVMPYIATKMFLFEPIFDNPRFIEILQKMELPLPGS